MEGLNGWQRFLVLVLFLPAAASSQAQITTHTALPVGKGEGIVRLQWKMIRATGDTSPMGREVRVVSFPFVGVYGVTSRLTLFGVVPLLDKSLEVSLGNGRARRTATGVADVRLFGRYTIYQRNTHGRTVRLASFGGVELPTGSDDAVDDAGRLPRAFQLGSGSWDPFAGLVYSRQTFAWQIDGSVTYKLNPESNGFRFGNETRVDVAAKVRLLPRTLGRGLPSFLYGNLETNLLWQGENWLDGVVDANSGGMVWYLGPGVQHVTRRTILEAAFQLPILQDPNGTALQNDLIATLSVRLGI